MRLISCTGLLLVAMLGLIPQKTYAESEAVMCDAHNVSARVIAAKRVSSSSITLEVEYENHNNLAVQLNAAGGVMLIDSNGERWEGSGNGLSKNGRVPPGVKFKEKYRFTKMAGGQDVVTVNFVHTYRVWAKGGLKGSCKFSAKSIPLSGKD